MSMWILHSKDTRLAGRCQLRIEVGLEETGADLVDLRDCCKVCYSYLTRRDAYYAAIMLMELIDVKDATACQGMITQHDVGVL